MSDVGVDLGRWGRGGAVTRAELQRRTESGNGWTLHCCDCLQWMAEQPEASVDHVICDPPYSEEVHRSVRSGGRRDMPDAALSACRTRSVVDLGFEHITPEERAGAAAQFARLSARWTLVFSDVESCHLWRTELVSAGMKYKRTGAWDRLNGAPQFHGGRPASGIEAVTIAHRPGRSRWNGGGARAIWHHPIVINRIGHRGDRLSTAQKPLGLMCELRRTARRCKLRGLGSCRCSGGRNDPRTTTQRPRAGQASGSRCSLSTGA